MILFAWSFSVHVIPERNMSKSIALSLNDTICRLTGLRFVNRFLALTELRSVNRPNRHIPAYNNGFPAHLRTGTRSDS